MNGSNRGASEPARSNGKRIWLDKPDGGKRPIGLPTLEDKIVQSAVVNVLNAIYECDFHGLSYGFRPGRNQHQALQAVQTFLQKGRVNWVLDLDLKGRYLVLRKTARKRLRRHLFHIRVWLRKHRHRPLQWQWNKLSQHLAGYYQYYGIRGNYRALARYRWRL